MDKKGRTEGINIKIINNTKSNENIETILKDASPDNICLYSFPFKLFLPLIKYKRTYKIIPKINQLKIKFIIKVTVKYSITLGSFKNNKNKDSKKIEIKITIAAV